MQLSLRLILLVGSLLIFTTVLRSIRRRKILMASATSWVGMAVLLLLCAVFPDVRVRLSELLGFQSPANFVFLVVIGVLVVKSFRDTAKLSIMRNKVDVLAQELALMSTNKAMIEISAAPVCTSDTSGDAHAKLAHQNE